MSLVYTAGILAVFLPIPAFLYLTRRARLTRAGLVALVLFVTLESMWYAAVFDHVVYDGRRVSGLLPLGIYLEEHLFIGLAFLNASALFQALKGR